MRLAVGMTVYGRPDLTSQVLSQIESERAYVDVFLCDNAGDFSGAPSWVKTYRQKTNLGWLHGTNQMWREVLLEEPKYDAFIMLNNDVVLSEHFFRNLATAASRAHVGIVAPLYDDVCRFQRKSSYPAEKHKPLQKTDLVPFVDGTCMYVDRVVTESIGLLDEQAYGFLGWGADFDYCIRARAAGFKVGVTHSAYLNHFRRATADAIITNYKRRALRELRIGMKTKYGRFWGRHLESGVCRRSIKATRSFVTSFAPGLCLLKG